MSEDSRVRSLAPWVNSINLRLDEAWRNRKDGMYSQYITGMKIIKDDALTVKEVRRELEKLLVPIDRWFNRELVKIESKMKSSLISPEYIFNEKRGRTIQIEYSDKIRTAVQIALDENNMLVHRSIGEEGSI